MATIDIRHIDTLGVELTIPADEVAQPYRQGKYHLAREYRLCSAHRRVRGCYLGQSWYLQSYGRTTDPETIDLIHFDEDDSPAPIERALTWLENNGYWPFEAESGLYRAGPQLAQQSDR